MRSEASLPPDYFERMFEADPDPWRFETSPYEQAKYDRTIAALGGRRYGRALELGCAIGVLTQRLAGQADEIVAIDVSKAALAAARKRCDDQPGVRFERMVFPAETPDGSFDLILVSEVAYYWSDGDIASAGRWIDGALRPGGEIVLVHWTGETDYPQTGDAAVEKLRRAVSVALRPTAAERTELYRLDVWRRDP